jgi:predicted nucleic acid-binding protein
MNGQSRPTSDRLLVRGAIAFTFFVATALEHGLTLVSHDTSDYDKARVAVLNPWKVS